MDLLGGGQYEIVYDIEDALVNPPVEPITPLESVTPGEPEYYEWQDWLRYKEALAHQSKMYEGLAAYCERVAAYIKERCLPANVVIETAEDWGKIYNAALCPQVSIEDVKRAMRHNFGALWGGKDLFDALRDVEGGGGEYISTKVWETDLMIKLGDTETQYTKRGVTERARMIAALKIPELFRVLDADKQYKEVQAKQHG